MTRWIDLADLKRQKGSVEDLLKKPAARPLSRRCLLALSSAAALMSGGIGYRNHYRTTRGFRQSLGAGK
jgi:hypothetical protein